MVDKETVDVAIDVAMDVAMDVAIDVAVDKTTIIRHQQTPVFHNQMNNISSQGKPNQTSSKHLQIRTIVSHMDIMYIMAIPV